MNFSYEFRLKEISNKNLFTDVQITVSGEKIAAHKLILSGIENFPDSLEIEFIQNNKFSAKSQRFYQLFEANPEKSNFDIENHEPSVIRKLVDFLYDRKIEINGQEAYKVLVAAHEVSRLFG
jgi:hypothetical protein